MNIAEIIAEARQWATSADDAGEVAMAAAAWAAVDHLERARDLYYGPDEGDWRADADAYYRSEIARDLRAHGARVVP